MKKINKFFLMGSVALSGMMGFTSCSSDDAADENGQNPGVENGVVKTQFAINVPKAGGTRQTGDIVQEGNNWSFRGMTNIHLMSFLKNNAIGRGKTADKVQPLPQLNSYTGTYDKNQGYKVYNDVEIPLTTNNFLFYAEAIPSQNPTNHVDGVLNSSLSDSEKSLDNISFNLENIYKTIEDIKYSKNALLEIVNGLVALDSWKNASNKDHENYDAALEQVRNSFITLKAGSANSILLTLTKLYNFVAPYETQAGSAATEIKEEIEKNFTATKGANDVYTLTYKSSIDKKISNYPLEYNLPEGSAVLSYNASEQKFEYVDRLGSTVNTGTTTVENYINVSEITYPASLWYFANTPLYATTNGNFNDWPSSLTDWNTGTKFNGWSTEVEENSRVIALKEPINYANALLVTTIKVSNNEIKDANDVAYNPVIQPNAILVGDQPNTVNWEFLPLDKDGNPVQFNKTVYDNTLPSTVAVDLTNGNSTSEPLYTLLLDNGSFNSDGTRKVTEEQSVVNVAVEFINHGAEFQGAEGVIMSNQKFYLIGQLTPKSETGKENMSVFMRDYKTTLSLTVTSLKNAYNIIPDIRSNKLKFGLAVDLVWQEGLQFDVPFN